MVEEYASIIKNNVWEVVPRPEGKSVVTSRWLYKIKHVADGSIKKFKIHQMDVKTTFLNEVIEEEMYVEQPQGFKVLGQETHVCRLRRALYGLKQASRAWYLRIDTYLHQIVFTNSDADPNLYYIVEGDDPLILVLYVDDLFIIGAKRLSSDCKEDLAMEFEMKDTGLTHYFLGLEVW
eukprot:PITA_24496